MSINWYLAGWVIRSKNRPKVLRLLSIPQNPSTLAKKLKISLTHASKIVRELENKKLILCLNEQSRTGRIYKRTKDGEEIAKYLEKVKRD